MSAQVPIALQLDGPLAVATLSRAPVNAIDEAWLACLDDALARVERAEGVAALLVRSSERIFSAGADLELMRSRFDTPQGRERMVGFVREIQRVYARLARLPQVTIAEIGGAALGGGFELALACDLRIAAEQAKLGLPEARLGLLPGAGGTQRLTRIAGEATAKRLILGAETVSGRSKPPPSASSNGRSRRPNCRRAPWNRHRHRCTARGGGPLHASAASKQRSCLAVPVMRWKSQAPGNCSRAPKRSTACGRSSSAGASAPRPGGAGRTAFPSSTARPRRAG